MPQRNDSKVRRGRDLNHLDAFVLGGAVSLHHFRSPSSLPSSLPEVSNRVEPAVDQVRDTPHTVRGGDGVFGGCYPCILNCVVKR